MRLYVERTDIAEHTSPHADKVTSTHLICLSCSYFVPVARACLLPTLLVTKFDNESGIWLLRRGTYNGEQQPETDGAILMLGVGY